MGGQIEAIATALPSSGDAAELRAALAVMAMVGVTSGHQLLALPVPHDAPPNASPYCCARPSTPGLLGRLGARRRLPGMTGPFRTARLDVVPLRIEHAAEMAAVLSDPALHTFIGGAPASPENLRARYRRLVAGSPDPSVTWCNWVLRLREDSRLVGTSRPRSDRPSRRSPGWSAPRGSGGAWPPKPPASRFTNQRQPSGRRTQYDTHPESWSRKARNTSPTARRWGSTAATSSTAGSGCGVMGLGDRLQEQVRRGGDEAALRNRWSDGNRWGDENRDQDDVRVTSSVASTICRRSRSRETAGRRSAISPSRRSIMRRPISSMGWRTLVSGGSMWRAMAESS